MHKTIRVPRLIALLAPIVLAGAAVAEPVQHADAQIVVRPAQLTDAQIVAIYTQVNSFDIETALLGQKNGASEHVRNLAAHVAADHLGVRKAILELAKAEGLGFELPPARAEAQREHDTVMARLAGLKGRDFDKALLEHDIAFHKAAIEAVRTLLLPNAVNPKLKEHFHSVLPAFEGHLKATEDVAGGMPFANDAH